MQWWMPSPNARFRNGARFTEKSSGESLSTRRGSRTHTAVAPCRPQARSTQTHIAGRRLSQVLNRGFVTKDLSTAAAIALGSRPRIESSSGLVANS